MNFLKAFLAIAGPGSGGYDLLLAESLLLLYELHEGSGVRVFLGIISLLALLCRAEIQDCMHTMALLEESYISVQTKDDRMKYQYVISLELDVLCFIAW